MEALLSPPKPIIELVFADKGTHLAFRGSEFPSRLRANDLPYEIEATDRTLVNRIEAVYDRWSEFSQSHAEGAPRDQVDLAAKHAVLASARLRDSLLRLRPMMAERFADYRQAFAEWAHSSESPIVVRNLGLSVPWHLVYAGEEDIARERADAIDSKAFENLLGMRRRVIHNLCVNPERMADEDETGHREAVEQSGRRALTTVGAGIPGYASSTEASDRLRDRLEEADEWEIRALFTAKQHDQHFDRRNAERDHRVWILATHGQPHADQPRQRSLRLRGKDDLTASRLSKLTEPPYALAYPATVFMVSCRAAIQSHQWDIPEEMFYLGAGTVIGAHADVSHDRSLDLAIKFAKEWEDREAWDTFHEVQRSIEDPYDRLHANLYVPSLAGLLR